MMGRFSLRRKWVYEVDLRSFSVCVESEQEIDLERDIQISEGD